MTDPAIEAARRAFAEYWPDQGDFEFSHSNEGRFGIDAAREALRPIRELYGYLSTAEPFEDAEVGYGMRLVLDELEKLIFTPEELQ